MSKVTENDDRRARIDEVCRRGIPNADETNTDNRSGQRKKEQRDPLIRPPDRERSALREVAPEKPEESEQRCPSRSEGNALRTTLSPARLSAAS